MQASESKTSVKPKSQRNKTRLVFALLIFLAIIATIGYFVYVFISSQGNTLNNKKVFDKAQKAFNEFPGVSNLSKESRDKLKKEIEPQFLAGYVTGFGPNENDIKVAIAEIGDRPGPDTIKANIQNTINSKVELAKTTGYYQGYIFYFWFGKTISNKYPYEVIENWGDPATLAEDKKYAEAKANEYIGKLKKGSIQPHQIVDALASDKRLRLHDSANNSGYFTTGLPMTTDKTSQEEYAKLFLTTDDGTQESVQKLLSSVDGTGLTKLGLVVAEPGLPRSGVKKEVGFVVAYIETYLKGQNSIRRYEVQLKIARGKLK